MKTKWKRIFAGLHRKSDSKPQAESNHSTVTRDSRLFIFTTVEEKLKFVVVIDKFNSVDREIRDF